MRKRLLMTLYMPLQMRLKVKRSPALPHLSRGTWHGNSIPILTNTEWGRGLPLKSPTPQIMLRPNRYQESTSMKLFFFVSTGNMCFEMLIPQKRFLAAFKSTFEGPFAGVRTFMFVKAAWSSEDFVAVGFVAGVF